MESSPPPTSDINVDSPIIDIDSPIDIDIDTPITGRRSSIIGRASISSQLSGINRSYVDILYFYVYIFI